jgi:hypothetical protein
MLRSATRRTPPPAARDAAAGSARRRAECRRPRRPTRAPRARSAARPGTALPRRTTGAGRTLAPTGTPGKDRKPGSPPAARATQVKDARPTQRQPLITSPMGRVGDENPQHDREVERNRPDRVHPDEVTRAGRSFGAEVPGRMRHGRKQDCNHGEKRHAGRLQSTVASRSPRRAQIVAARGTWCAPGGAAASRPEIARRYSKDSHGS